MFQRVTIAGNLGRDPELRYMPNGTPTVTLSVATNSVYNNQKGEQVKETTWWRVSVFGKQAEICSQYLSKGRQVLVEGRMRPDPATGGPRIYTKQDGSHGASFDLVAQTVRFIGGRGDGTGGGGGGGHSGGGGGGGGMPDDMGMPDMGEDELPF